jgi:hypothetical protein
MSKPVSYTLKESDVLAARQRFREQESRDLFYRAATELVRLALDGQTSISVAEALGTLLQTWNKSFYRFHGKFDEAHFQALERVVEERSAKWQQWRGRSIETLSGDERSDISETFAALETIIGPVWGGQGYALVES